MIAYLRIHSFAHYSKDEDFEKQFDVLQTALDEVFQKCTPLQTDKVVPGCSPRIAGCEATRKISWTSCRIPVRPFVVILKAGN